jgi:hypothetical protein
MRRFPERNRITMQRAHQRAHGRRLVNRLTYGKGLFVENKNDCALSLLREYFELPKTLELPLDTLLCRINGSHSAINFTFWLETKTDFELSDEQAEKIVLKSVKQFIKTYRSLKNGNSRTEKADKKKTP